MIDFLQNLLSLSCMISVFRIQEYVGMSYTTWTYYVFVILQDEDQESVFMPNKNGKNYLCYLPKVEKSKSGKPTVQLNMSSMIVESEKRVKLKTPDELLEALKEQCFVRVRICRWILFCMRIMTIIYILESYLKRKVKL